MRGSAFLGYLFADLIFKDKGLTEFEQDFFYDRYCRPSFFGMEVSTEVVMGRYRPVSGVVAEFNAGVNLGIEGAWFMNPYVGFGGRVEWPMPEGMTQADLILSDKDKVHGGFDAYCKERGIVR